MRVRSLTVLFALLVPLTCIASLPVVAAPGDMGVFSTRCTFSHANHDDPIVHPGEEGAAHHHHYFGNTTTDYQTSTATLEAGDTTCDRPKDRAAYWLPALYENGTELAPVEAHIYYRNSNVNDKSATVPFPRGLRMVAGTPNHPDAPPGARDTEWLCAQGTSNVGTASIPATCYGEQLIALITFPSCWDGENLTTADQSHVVYPWQNTDRPRQCPDSHPVVLPELREHVRYSPSSDDLSGLTLSSGPSDTLHADFWNAWDERALARLVTNCLLAGTKCGTVGDPRP